MAPKKSSELSDVQKTYKKKLRQERYDYYEKLGNPLTRLAKAGIKAAPKAAKAAIKYAPGVGAARALAKARPTTGASIAGARPKINKEQAMVASNRYQAQAPKKPRKVKITNVSATSSYPKEITNLRSFSQNAKIVEIKPKRTKKLPVKASKKINK
jgi:hypothetical protein